MTIARTYKRTCQEITCGEAFLSARPDARFCCAAHRKKWHNRQAERGRLLYSLIMPNRHERELGTELHLQTVASRLCAHWLAEDQGAKTWDDPRKFLDDNPWLRRETKATYVRVGRM